MEPRRGATATRTAFLAVFFVALAIRAFALVVLSLPLAGKSASAIGVGLRIDGYHEVALQLASGHGLAVDARSGPTAARAPLYPALVALLYRGFGASPAPVLWAQAILGALTCALLFLLGCRIFDLATGLVAGILFALYPPHLVWSLYIMTETLFVLLLVASGLALVRLAQSPSIRNALVAGAVLGLTALCNPVVLLLPPVLVLVVAVTPGHRRSYLRPALIVLVVMGAIVAPWTARNYLRFHRLIPVSWGAGATYVRGTLIVERHQELPGEPMWKADQAATQEMIRLLRSNGLGRAREGLAGMGGEGFITLEEDEFFRRFAWEWMRGNPLGAARKFVTNLGLYWYYSRHALAYQVLNFPLCLLALLGLALGAWRKIETKIIVLFSLYMYLIYSWMLGCARYSLHIMPFVCALAAAAVIDVARRAGRARSGAPAVGP